MRVCQKMRWTLTEWSALPEWERIEWLAYELHLQEEWRENCKVIGGAKYVEQGTLLSVLALGAMQYG